jgi:hypothetical protein
MRFSLSHAFLLYLEAIQGYTVTGELCSFYDAYGCVDVQQLTQFLIPQKHVMLGWFRFRRGIPLRPTLRELSVHRHLESLYPVMNTKFTSLKVCCHSYP